MKMPKTIRNPEKFNNSPAAGFDGVFDWSWTQGCFGNGKITPMDFDGVVERNGQFLIFETKEPGAKIPKGQLYTLQACHRLGCFTILLIWGKQSPETAELWYPDSTARKQLTGVNEIRNEVQLWYAWANNKYMQKHR